MAKLQFRSPDKNIVDMRKKQSAAGKVVSDLRGKFTAGEDHLIGYEVELMDGFARNQINAGWSMPLFVLLVASVGVSSIGWQPAAIWFLLTTLAYLLLSALSKRYLKQQCTEEELAKWRRNFLIVQLMISGAWAIFAFFDCLACNGNQYSIIQFSTLLVFQAVTAMLSYAFGRSFLIITVPASLILSLRFVTSPDKSLIIMGIIIVVSVLFFYFIADRFKRSIITMFKHANEKESLIVDLETAKSFSEEARNRAEEANLAKSRFLATMSHELRTPLNAILGFSEIMRDEVMGPIENANYRDYINDIHKSGTHLLNLISEILDISRIEAGKHDLKEEEISLVHIADEATHMVMIKAKQKGISLETSFEQALSPIWGDERAIRQVMLNLLSNALKFTPTGGTITVKTGWTRMGGQYLSVTDSGPGIAESEIPLVLSSFGQGAIAIRHADQGTGLGLSIVQALLHLHQGKFELKSKLREGTHAVAYLPQARVMKT